MSTSFTLVSGAKKNVGDFLIYEKCRELILHFLTPENIVELKRQEDFDPYIDDINKTNAIIICGGPGYRRDFYPITYPFLKYLNRLKPRIIPFGLGWEGEPIYQPQFFDFNDRSMNLIRRIHSDIEYSSTRDYLTKGILSDIGISNVINTGCPTLFDIEKMKHNEQFRKPKTITKVGISIAQNPMLFEQNLELLRRVNNLLPDTVRYAFFHRGVGEDKFTKQDEGEALRRIVVKTKELGYEIVDLSYDRANMRKYNDVDLHIGYRVHGHAYCMNQRIPSFLLWEDGRGQGMSLNLRLKGIPARSTRPTDIIPVPFRYKRRIRIMEKRKKILAAITINNGAVDSMISLVSNQLNNNFSMFDQTPKVLSILYERFKKFLASIERQNC
jgi:hypothetical protein